MAYTALQLINRAFYLSQIVSRQLQTVTGDQVADGLYLLNALFDVKGSDLRLIPYFQQYEFITNSGQEEYFVPGLLYCDSMTFNIGQVRYPMIEMTRKQYFSTARIDNITTLPWSYRVERSYHPYITTTGGTITLVASSDPYQYYTGTNPETIVLPAADTLVVGQQFTIANNSTNNITVQSSGLDTVAILSTNTSGVFTCILASGTTAASWSYAAGNQLSATGSSVYLYFFPADGYVVKIWGKFGLSDVSLNTDLTSIYDPFYVEYLRYALAEYICCEWGVTFPDEAKKKYEEIRKKLLEISPADLSMSKRSYFSSGATIDWQLVNIGRGWTPW